ncbi:molybdopterin-dependent oxidoreductase [Streptomyces sp. KAU_LT]|uniref:molybdopterin-dependent oxidoreductase n=1 Tax=Streptomyces sp. KAU_LT TaxID=3046669 RepID=UPI0024B7CA16|nr:molybdopterin-dependent oxidoreductase [Streptomyces sp. KAU_LT]MDI9835213.1 molybdopterin-dependent oxidoreductase [Streptomyces sp. KAU_LT]
MTDRRALLDRLPVSPRFWRSPLRGTWLTSVLGVVLLAGVPLLFVTGLLSYAAYNPGLSPLNDKTPDKGLLGFYLFSWPTDPHWLYRVTQGVHVTLGVALIPVLLAKLWSVIPRFFALPPVRSPAQALDRLSLLFLVGGGLFTFLTGVLNVQLDYVFPGSFYRLHFYGAWVFFAAFAAHAALKIPRTVRAFREHGGPLAHIRSTTSPAPAPHDDLAAPDPAPPTLSRRGLAALVGGSSLLLLLTTAGQSVGGPLRRTALFAPHGGGDPGGGPNGFQVNKPAALAGVTAARTGEAWQLVVTGPSGQVRLSRADLLAMPQHTAALPIACVEGWSTEDQLWRGVRLRDLAALVGYEPEDAPDVLVESLQLHGSFRRAALRHNQVRDPRSLLALQVNGADLSPDHGYPARVIVPAAPGVLNTKWVARLTFGRVL